MKLPALLLAALLALGCAALGVAGADCSNFNSENQCAGNVIEQHAEFANRKFQTPPRGSADWKPAFQDYSEIVGYPRVIYAADGKSAIVTAIVFLKDQTASVTYATNLDPTPSSAPVFKYDATTAVEVTITATAALATGATATLVMEPVHFVWNNVPLPASIGGQKGAIVELFGWPYADVAAECEFLGKAGYASMMSDTRYRFAFVHFVAIELNTHIFAEAQLSG
jgi:alpha-amylase